MLCPATTTNQAWRRLRRQQLRGMGILFGTIISSARVSTGLVRFVVRQRTNSLGSSSIPRRAPFASSVSGDDLDSLLDEIRTSGGSDTENSRILPVEENESKGGSPRWCSDVDWLTTTTSSNSGAAPSPIESILIDDRIVYIKRDDLIRLPGSQLSGNKARKVSMETGCASRVTQTNSHNFFILLIQMLALHNLDSISFPADCVVSYGGPQSNAMLAIAAAVRYHNEQRRPIGLPSIRFLYYTRTLPSFLQQQSTGNLFRALSLGMELRQVSPTEYHNLFGGAWGGCESPPASLVPPSDNALWIPQGGACRMAVEGVRGLAREILEDLETGDGSATPTTLVIPGGTCTTAVLLQYALRDVKHVQVAVIPCVGDALYAERQMQQLLGQLVPEASLLDRSDLLPLILPADPDARLTPYLPFGMPQAETLETYQYLQEEHDLELDLLYGAPAWTILLRHLRRHSTTSCMDGRRVVYIHTGGLEGIHTQLMRYKYKGLIRMEDSVVYSKLNLPKCDR